MHLCKNRYRFSNKFKILSKYTLLALVVVFFNTESAVAKRHKHYRYAKEEFKPQPRTWGSLEYMSMWQNDGPTSISLVTQNNDPTYTAALSDPGTQIIYGDRSRQDLNYGNINGGRITLGGWIGDYDLYGLEFSGFLLEKAYTNYAVSSPGGEFPVVSIPYFATQPSPGSESSVAAKSLDLTNNPNNISVNTGSQLWGAELNLVYNMLPMTGYPLQALVGFRYLSLVESLTLTDAIFDTTPADTATNGVVSFSDDFQTKNNFYGLGLGLRTNLIAQNALTLDLTAKVSLGGNVENIDITGSTLVTREALGNTSGVYNTGIFAQSSNSGSTNSTIFAVLPELQVKLGYNIAPNVHPYIGYDIMYINNVVRPGQQMDRNINSTKNSILSGGAAATGPASPTSPGFHNTSYWIQGIMVGFEARI